ncbi:hypothetical protein DMA11_05245 [Marinilabiliaceae bacterium JC017]|nr:hypothetical protein DMA11_05245 [Marinilabiliaceae bacterium JC017]
MFFIGSLASLPAYMIIFVVYFSCMLMGIPAAKNGAIPASLPLSDNTVSCHNTTHYATTHDIAYYHQQESVISKTKPTPPGKPLLKHYASYYFPGEKDIALFHNLFFRPPPVC